MVSVCIPTYNGAKYIKEQLESILSQLGINDEVIISDDQSSDNTLEIIREFHDPRIIILSHPKTNQKFTYGYTANNLEYALGAAKGDYIFLSDQDDVWLPDKLKLFMRTFADADIVLSDCTIVDKCLNVLYSSKFKLEGVKVSPFNNLIHCGYLGCCMAFKRGLLQWILPFPTNVPHDLWIGLVGEKVGRFKMLRESTLLYRRHDFNVSATNNLLLNKNDQLPRNNNLIFFKIHYRLFVIHSYLKFLIKFSRTK